MYFPAQWLAEISPQVTSAGSTFLVTFTTPVQVQPNQAILFTLTGNIAMNPARLETSSKMYAGVLTVPPSANGALWLAAAYGLAALVSGYRSRRRMLLILSAVLFVTATSVGCGGSGNPLPAPSNGGAFRTNR